MSIAGIYLKNLAKRIINEEKVYPAEIVNAPKIIDKAYGNCDGHLDFEDITDIASNVGSEIAEAADSVLDFISSIL